MTATPGRVVVEASSIVAALVVPGRARGLQLQRLQQDAAEGGFTSCVVIRAKGRRGGAGEELVCELLTGSARASVVVLPSLSVLHPLPARALGLLGALLSAGLRVVSPRDAWVASVDSQTVSSIATYLANDEIRRNSRRGRSSIAGVRSAGRKTGRPAKPVKDIEEARRLVTMHGYRMAARLLGNTSASSIRRALLKAEAVARQVNQGRGL